MAFEERINNFRADLPAIDTLAILNKYVYTDSCACLLPAQHTSLKTRISGKFEIAAQNIVVVGSSKMGFSIERWTPRFGPLGAEFMMDSWSLLASVCLCLRINRGEAIQTMLETGIGQQIIQLV